MLFVEDVRSVQARNRQEKLAAMGRVSAGIAHEIRNPLAAITQANALLQEDVTTEGQARLAAIVADNVERLKRIVDDVTEVAPGALPTPSTIDASAKCRPPCASGPAPCSSRSASAAGCTSTCLRSPWVCCSIPTICGVCLSTCSTTHDAMPATRPGRSC